MGYANPMTIRGADWFAAECVKAGVDGVICGHIHTAEIRDIAGVQYYNDGDWVEGCTALVEHASGAMEVLHWADEIAKRGEKTPALMAA